MADSAAIYAAVAGRLASDATLSGLMPDGVWRDVSPAGKTNVVIISKMADTRAYAFNAMATEEFTYLVKAVSKATSGVTASAAAARIYFLLQNASFAITGYTLMLVQQTEENGSVEYAEPDPVDKDARWNHRGWLFDVMVSPT